MRVQVIYKIYEARMKLGISLRQLSELSGVSKSMINYAENNKKDLTLTELIMLAVALGVSPEELYTYNCPT